MVGREAATGKGGKRRKGRKKKKERGREEGREERGWGWKGRGRLQSLKLILPQRCQAKLLCWLFKRTLESVQKKKKEGEKSQARK